MKKSIAMGGEKKVHYSIEGRPACEQPKKDWSNTYETTSCVVDVTCKKCAEHLRSLKKIPRKKSLADSEKFYNLMQAYRYSPITDQELVVKNFNNVIKFVESFKNN